MGKHYVPRKYLAGFATPNDDRQIWMYDKRTREWRLAAISKVAQEVGYFDADTEGALNETVEHPAHIVLGKVRRRERISADERSILAVYAAVMFKRVPAGRRRASALIEPTIRSVIARYRVQLAAEVNTPEDERRLKVHLEHLDRLEKQYLIEAPEEMRQRVRSPWPSERIAGAVEAMTWRFAVSKSPALFITSDNPAFYFESLGVGNQDSELTFPLANDLALLGSWQGPPGSLLEVGARPSLVKEVNRRIASGAERFIFSHHPYPWVTTLAHKAKPQLSRIGW
jgi:hypothetical protein